MISSRWPRPIGMSASIALIPVWTGVSTDLPDDHARCDALDGPSGLRVDRPLVIERTAERVDDTTEQRRPDRDLDDPARSS